VYSVWEERLFKFLFYMLTQRSEQISMDQKSAQNNKKIMKTEGPTITQFLMLTEWAVLFLKCKVCGNHIHPCATVFRHNQEMFCYDCWSKTEEPFVLYYAPYLNNMYYRANNPCMKGFKEDGDL
jgi:hypothetical protein